MMMSVMFIAMFGWMVLAYRNMKGCDIAFWACLTMAQVMGAALAILSEINKL